MQETSEIKEITGKLKIGHYHLIAIDGMDGSGKSTLSQQLASELGYIHINIDEYLEKNHGQFVRYIRYSALRTELDNAAVPIIIEGVCLLAVLEKLQKNPDIFIYVKRMSDYGSWRDEEKCNVREDIDEFINREKENLLKFCKASAHIEGNVFDPNECAFPMLAEEIIRYHYYFKPHKKADIIYKRIV